MVASTNFEAVQSVMEAYFLGLHRADSTQLAAVFHPDATYVNATNGDYMKHDMKTYFGIIAARTSPEDLGEEQSGEILSVEFGSNTMAFVKARMTMLARDYQDFLTLVHTDGCWQIMSKIFTYTAHTKEA